MGARYYSASNSGSFDVSITYNCAVHDYTSVVTAATCTEDGFTTYTCSVCGKTVTEIISKTDHTDENKDGICDICGNNVSDILPGETKRIKAGDNEIVYLKFIPLQSGFYTFTSIPPEYDTDDTNGDTYGYLYDENKEVIESDDDSGKGYNFKITYNLTAATAP